MRRYNFFFLFIVSLITIFISDSNGFAVDNIFSRKTLHGINGINVVVEDLGPEIERKGLKGEQIQTDVESKLKLAGIQVLTKSELFREIGMPWISVKPTIMKLDQCNGFVYFIEILAYQRATLIRNENVHFVITWSNEMIGTTPDLTNIRNIIKNQMDEFLNALLSVNPKNP